MIQSPDASRPPAQPRLTAERLLGLDALRGIAALCVVFLHASALYPQLPHYSGKAYLAVDFFFMLSGFVMARTYEGRLAKGYLGAQFFFARYRRLWPTMVVGGLLFLPFLHEAAPEPGLYYKLVVLNLLLLPALTSREIFPLNVPAWSVFYELVANLLHGYVLWRLPVRWLGGMCIVALMGVAVASYDVGSMDIGSGKGELLGGISRVLFSYGMGIIIWRCWGERRLHAAWGIAALLAMPVLFAVPGEWLLGYWPYDLAVEAVCCPLILIGGLSVLRSPGDGPGKWAARWAGELSFPLYAIHFPLLYWFRDWQLPAELAILLCLPAAAVVSLVTQSMRTHRSTTRHNIM
ncbi:MAG: acyltransferase [Novosphingobium sp.]